MSVKSITVIPGDGIGPDITEATLKVFERLDCHFDYDFCEAGVQSLEKGGELLPERTLQSMAKNKVVLKGPLTTPIGEGFTSINVTLRKRFGLYANLRPVVSYPNTKSNFANKNIDIITVRENTEGLYCGLGQTINSERTHAEAKSVITREGSERITRFAYEMARKLARKKVTIVHKANILKTTSGLFLEVGREMAKRYPDIETNELIVDNACMQLVMYPEKFDVIVTTNLFGDILSDLTAGLTGGLGLAPGANIGEEMAMFEAVHGSAPALAGKNVANPSSLILAGAMMLDHIGENEKANRIRRAIRSVLESRDRLTKDLGGTASTTDFLASVLAKL